MTNLTLKVFVITEYSLTTEFVITEHFVNIFQIVAVILSNTGIALLAYMDGVAQTRTLGGVVLAAAAAAGSATYKVNISSLYLFLSFFLSFKLSFFLSYLLSTLLILFACFNFISLTFFLPNSFRRVLFLSFKMNLKFCLLLQFQFSENWNFSQLYFEMKSDL